MSRSGVWRGSAGDPGGGRSPPADKARIAGGQGRVGLAGGAALVVARHGQPRLGDAGAGGGLSEGVIGGISPAQAQSRDVERLVGAGVLVGKGGGRAGSVEGDGVAADDPQQRGTGGIEGSAGGGVIDLVGRGNPRDGQPFGG